MLFSEASCNPSESPFPSVLPPSFCQWPGDPTKLVVFGYPMGSSSSSSDAAAMGAAYRDPEDDSPLSSRACYLTVTAVPSLDGCKACVRVAASYEEEDIAETWNSCARLSCLEHGLTVHTAFDLVPPFPRFEPKVSLKRDGVVLINTGNLLHSLQISQEMLTGGGNGDDPQGLDEPPPSLFDPTLPGVAPAADPCQQWSELSVATGSEFTLYGGEVFSPPSSAALWSPCSSVTAAPTSQAPVTSDSETTDCESEHGGSGAGGGGGKRKKRSSQHVFNQERLEKVAEFVEQLHSPPNASQHQMMTRRKRSLWQRLQQTGEPSSSSSAAAAPGPSPSACSSRQAAAEKAYELTDDDFDEDGVREKLSTFRKKRLAEKTYEFKEEDDSENITPLPKLRSQKERAAAAAGTGRDGRTGSQLHTYGIIDRVLFVGHLYTYLAL